MVLSYDPAKDKFSAADFGRNGSTINDVAMKPHSVVELKLPCSLKMGGAIIRVKLPAPRAS